MNALRVRGPYRGPSGYDHHVREFVRELHRQGVALQLIEEDRWGPATLPDAARDPWFETLADPVDATITLHFTIPTQVVPDGETLDVNYTMFEATGIPPAWLYFNQQHALVIVPTASSRDAWVASGYDPDRVAICPLGINTCLFGSAVSPLPLVTATGVAVERFRTRFLNVSEVGPRKNLPGLLRAWLLATRADDDAILVLKLGRYIPGWFDVLRMRIRQLEGEVGREFRQAAPVEFCFDMLADAQMPRLYASATHYISTSHGEGWDQAMVEAAASGLRLIAPDHSAYHAYLTAETATLLPSAEVPATFDGDPYLQQLFEGRNWWEPDTASAVAAIRAAIDEPEGGPYGAREYVLNQFSWEQATRRLIEILDCLEP